MRGCVRRSWRNGLFALTAVLATASLFTSTVGVPVTAQTPFKVAFLPVGPITDRAWSQTGYEGLVRAQKELGVQISFSDQAVPPADAERVARAYVQQGNQLIIFHGGQFVDAARNMSKQFPKVWFCVGGLETSGPNICSYDPLAQEGTFLAGALAATMSKTGRLGLIGGFTFPQLTRQLEGFKLGARYVKPNIRFQEVYINTWSDVAKGRSAATSLIDSRADVVFAATDEAAQGAFSAAQQRQVYAIASYANQNDLAPRAILASVIYDLSSLVFNVIKQAKDRKLQGKGYTGGVRTGVLRLAYNDRLVSSDVKAKIETIRQAIASGKLRIPSTEALGKPGASAKMNPKSLMSP